MNGDLKFKVADSAIALRFYPFIEQTIQASSKVETKTANPAAPATTPALTQPPTAAAQASNPLHAAVLESVQTTTPVKTPDSTPVSNKWTWAVFAIGGLVATGYLVLRRG